MSVIQSFNDWLALHQQWIFIAAFTASFVESFAIIGVIVPGVALLFGIAAVAASAGVSVSPLLVAAFAGAVAGDCCSFFIGRHFHQKIRQLPPFTTHPNWVKKGERYFLKHGAISIVAGRFVGPLRPLIPLIAGMFQMPPIKFISINCLSAVAWAPTYIVPGFLVGLSFDANYGLQRQHSVFILFLCLLIWFADVTLHRTLALSKNANTHLKLHFTNIYLRKILGTGQSVMSLSFVCLCAALFIAISALVKLGLVDGVNIWVHELFITLRHPWIDPFVIAISEFGNSAPMALCGSLIVVFFLIQRWWSTALCFLTILVSSPLVIAGLKNYFAVVRPISIIAPPSSPAFPSGHTAIIAILTGFITMVLLRYSESKHHKKITQVSLTMVALVSISRLYLGVHWLSDILGGLLLSATALGVIYIIYTHLPEQKVSISRAIMGIIVAMLISTSLLVAPRFSEARLRFAPIDVTLMNPAYLQSIYSSKTDDERQISDD